MPIAFTSGEPSGIGPDIAIIHAQKEREENLLVYCDPDVLINRAKQLNFCLLYTSPSPRDGLLSRMPSSA